MAHLVQHQYSRLNSILLGTCFKHYSFHNLRFTEVHSSVFKTLHLVAAVGCMLFHRRGLLWLGSAVRYRIVIGFRDSG